MEKEEVKMKYNIGFMADVTKDVSYSLYKDYFPVLKNLTISSNLEDDFKNLKLRITSNPEFMEEVIIDLPFIPGMKDTELGDLVSQIKGDYLLKLVNREEAYIILSLEGLDEEVKKEFKVDLIPLDQWPGYGESPELTSVFSIPEDDVVAGIYETCIKTYKEDTGKDDFTGYGEGKEAVLNILKAIYKTIDKVGIKYIIPPQNYAVVGQKVRFPKEIIESGFANNLDITMLFSSLLERAKLNPVVIFVRDHACLGVFLERETFSEAVIYDVTSLLKRVAKGVERLMVFNPVTAMAGVDEDLNSSIIDAKERLQGDEGFLCAVDIRKARMIMNPLKGKKSTTIEDQYKFSSANGEKEDIETIDGNIGDKALGKRRLWERKLLDISLRNNLINLRLTQSTIQVVAPNLEDLLGSLLNGKEIDILPRPEDWDKLISDLDNNPGRELSMFKDFSKEEFKEGKLRSLLSLEELEKRGNKIARSAKLSLEENGANTFFLVLGLLKYFPKAGDKEKYAPLVLLPVDMASRISGSGFKVKVRDEDAIINVTLLELLKQDFSLDLSNLDPLPLKEDGSYDLERVFSIIRKAIMNEPGWDIREEACLGLFSFMRFIMWNDLKENFDEFSKNPLVKSLVEGQNLMEVEAIELKEDFVEDEIKKNKAIFPVSSDSSQAMAIMAAKEGKSFVLHGPPGTGKSQTITNIIANALLDGKRVLFAAQKMAALEVVEKRLNEIGIGSFCLEVHSSKARKKSVLDQLENSMKIARIKKTDEGNAIGEKAMAIRDDFNNISKSLYSKDESGYSVYDLLYNYASLKDFDKFLLLGEDFDPSNLKEKEELLAKVINSGANAGGPYRHPLRGLEIKEYRPEIREEITSILKGEYGDLGTSLRKLTRDSEFRIRSIKDLFKIESFVKDALSLIGKEGRIFSLASIETGEEELNKIADSIERIKGERAKILSSFKEEVLNLNPDELQKSFEEDEDRFIVARMFQGNGALKELNALSKSHVYKKDEISLVISALKKYRDDVENLNKEIGSKNEILHNYLGAGIGSDELKVRSLAKEIGDFVRNNKEEGDSSFDRLLKLAEEEKFKEEGEDFLNKLSTHKENLEKLIKICDIHEGELEDGSLGNPIEVIEERKEEIIEGLSSLKEWIWYRKIYDEAKEKGLVAFLDYYEKGEVREDELLPAFKKSVYREILIRRLNKEKILLNLTGKTLEDKVNDLNKLIEENRLEERRNLYQTLGAKIPNLITESATSKELMVLQRAIRSSARGLSIRKLFKETKNLLARIAPCMLMSPMSIAQFLEAEYGMFDLVVFDEASQVPTPEAIGALGRGKQCIIVGDPKQLPPTSFFMTKNSLDEFEDSEEEDLDNILEDCLALSMTESYLLWHYRSRHESLIAFSNRNFYDNMLYTYPSPKDMVSMVTLRENKGIYDRGGSRTNRVEAEEIVGETVKRLKSKDKKSLGIVTFSSVQQDLIEDLLMEEFKKDPDLEGLAYNSGEPLFIKNLENVQGDERDVILFSVGYGKDKDGNISMNFGPINQEGGWRRLNVAVSRARHEMVVFTNIDPNLFNVSRSSARGVIDLKNFLQYAKDGRRKISMEEAKRESQDMGLASIIAERLREEGFKTEINVGSSKFKVDLAIVHPDKEDTFILGIMCGGPSYRDALSSYDREILQTSVLKGLGWDITSIYPLDYLDSEDKEIERIKGLVESIRRRENDPELQDESGLNELPVGDDFSSAIPKEVNYILNNIGEKEVTMDEFVKVSNAPSIYEDLKEIIKLEGPIPLRLLTLRIKDKYKLSKVTDKTEKQVEMILNKDKPTITREGDKIWYWNIDKVEDFKVFRKTLRDDNRRLLSDINPLEIKNGIIFLLSGEDLSEKNLIRSVSNLFSYPRLNVENELYIKNVIDLLILNGELERTKTNLISLKEDLPGQNE